jgi:hypothetical protein
LEFKDAWVRTNLPEKLPASIDMKEVDKVIHAERAISGGGKVTYEARWSSWLLELFLSTKKSLTLFQLAAACRGPLQGMVTQKSWTLPR